MTNFLSNRPFTFALTTLAVAIATQTAHGATVTLDSNGEPETTLPEIVVTANRTPTLASNTIAQTTVIDEDDLQRYHGQSVLDVLANQAGLSIKQNGGDGVSSTFTVRGLPAKYVLVLIDGIRYGSLSTGYAELNLLPADQVDRIEVLQGASGGSLYGADAIGGVIQIFTKGQNATNSNVAVSLGAGSENSYKGQITGQFVNSSSTLSLSTGYQRTDGINILKNATGKDLDKDGFESKNISIVGKHKINDKVSVGLTGLFAKSKTDVDYGDHQDQKNGSISGYVDYQNNTFSANLKYGESRDEMAYFSMPSATSSNYNTKQKQANLLLSQDLQLGKVIGGAEWLKQSFDGATSYTNRERDVTSGFLGYQINQPTYDILANLRYDKNSQYGNQTTYNLGGAYHINPSLRLGASYATGFKMPSLNDLYGFNEASQWGAAYIGNPNLKPETSKNWEAFIEHHNSFQNSRITGFKSDIKDGIISAKATSGDNTRTNRAETQIQGVSLTSDWNVDNVLFGLNYTNQRVKGRNNNTTDFIKVKTIPENMGMLYVGYRQPKFDIRTELQYTDKSNDGFTNKELDNYTLLNISGNYYINDKLTLSSRINNLTNKDYETYDGYNSKGINSFVSLTYQWF